MWSLAVCISPVATPGHTPCFIGLHTASARWDPHSALGKRHLPSKMKWNWLAETALYQKMATQEAAYVSAHQHLPSPIMPKWHREARCQANSGYTCPGWPGICCSPVASRVNEKWMKTTCRSRERSGFTGAIKRKSYVTSAESNKESSVHGTDILRVSDIAVPSSKYKSCMCKRRW